MKELTVYILVLILGITGMWLYKENEKRNKTISDREIIYFEDRLGCYCNRKFKGDTVFYYNHGELKAMYIK